MGRRDPGSSGRPPFNSNTTIGAMLRGLRAASSGPIGKTIMSICVGLLVIAFGYWGIGDIFRNGFSPSAVATVGSARMSVDEFRQLYNNRLQLVSRQLRQPI